MADPTTRLAPALRSMLAAARQEADRALLDRFVRSRDETAFGELMHRHGPMVFGVSRRLTRDAHRAEDVFQATFLLLARKAPSIRNPDALGAWLHRTAFRLAIRARRPREVFVARRDVASPLDTLTAREMLAVLDEELASLAEEHRAAVVLCGLEGLSLEEAARRLGWSVGSVKGRLERGRAKLRQRLEQRGLSLSGAMSAPLLDGGSCAGLIQATQAVVFESKASASVMALVEGGMPAMSLAKFTLVSTVVLVVGALGLGAGQRVGPSEKPAPMPAAGVTPIPKGARLRLGVLERRAVGAKIAVTADGKSIVAVSPDTRQITEWDFRTGKLRERRALPIKEVGEVRQLSPDGRWLVTNEAGEGRYGQRAVVWDVRAGKVARKLPFSGARVGGQPAAFSADGRCLALPALVVDEADDNKTKVQIRVWDWQRGEVLLLGELIGRDSVGQVAFSANGNQVLLTLHADNNGIHCWDVAKKKKLWTNTPRRTERMVVLPQGRVLSLERREVIEHDLLTGTVASTLRLPPRDPDHDVVPIPGGRKLLYSCEVGVVVWDLASGRPTITIPAPWAQVAPAHDGKSVVTNTGSLQRWDLATRDPLFPDEESAGHVDEVRALQFTADGTRLISGSADGSLAVWDRGQDKPLRRWRQYEPRRRSHRWMHPRGGVLGLDATPDGRWLFSAGEEDLSRLWDVASDKEFSAFPTPEPLNPSYSETLRSLRIAYDGRSALGLLCPGSGGFGKEVTGRLLRWDLDAGKVTTVCPVDRLVYWTSAIEPEGRWFANLGRVFDARTGREFARLDEYGTKAPVDAAFSPDGLLIVGGSSWRSDNNSLVREGPSIHVWEAVTGKVVARLAGPGLTGEKAFLSGGRHLAYNQHLAIHLLDLRSEKDVKTWEMPAELNLDGLGQARVSSFAFSPDGKTLATGHYDGTILLWDADLPDGKLAPVRAGEPASLWEQLGDADAKKAYHAAWRLAELPDVTVPMLRERVKPARAAAAKVSGLLISDLDADTQAKRDEATKRLRALGHGALPALREAQKSPASAEQKRRLQQLVVALENPGALSADQLRDLRAVQVLGWINTPAARKLLQALSKGNAADPVTQQANACLWRRR